MANKNSCVFVNIYDVTQKEGKHSVVVLTWKTHRLCRMGIIQRLSSWIKCMSKVIFWVCCFSIASRVIWHIAWRYYFVSCLITFFISYHDSFANLSVPYYFSIFSFIPWINFRISRVHQKRLLEEPFREFAQSTNQPAQTEMLRVFLLELYH